MCAWNQGMAQAPLSVSPIALLVSFLHRKRRDLELRGGYEPNWRRKTMSELFPGLTMAPNIHPLIVHFPIALWSAALFFSVVGALRAHEDLFRTGRWLVYLGTLGAAAALATGYWATEKMGHDAPGHDLVHVHRDFMLIASGLGLLTTGLFFWLRTRTRGTGRWVCVAALALTVAVMTLGADRGAALVYVHGVGVAVDAAPPPKDDHDHSEMDAHGAAAQDAVPRKQNTKPRKPPSEHEPHSHDHDHAH